MILYVLLLATGKVSQKGAAALKDKPVTAFRRQ
jgi:hypothetical protein